MEGNTEKERRDFSTDMHSYVSREKLVQFRLRNENNFSMLIFPLFSSSMEKFLNVNGTIENDAASDIQKN